jgi:hypothetical protein
MTLGAAAFVGYAVIFSVRNFTDSFLELGIGRGQVSVAKVSGITALRSSADVRCRDLLALEQDGGDLSQGVGACLEARLPAQVVHDR